MNDIQLFNNPEFGNVRVKMVGEEPWFCLTDVCEVLGLKSFKVAQRLDSEDGILSRYTVSDSLGRQNYANFVNEDGLYDVILDSRKPEAKMFRKWITSEVLPSIRKKGVYMTGEAAVDFLSNPEKLAAIILEYAEEKKRRTIAEQRVEEAKPKIVLADAITSSTNSMYIGDLAKIIRQNGVPVGQKRLFAWLRENKYLMPDNRPYQNYMEQGLFEIKVSTYESAQGKKEYMVTKVTGKGQQHIINKFLGDE